MFYWLTELSSNLSIFNVFRYITFRTGGAVVTAMIFVFLFGGPIIDMLRIKQGKGQPIRAEGIERHVLEKSGTPTMGGVMILAGLFAATLLWGDLASVYVWAVLLVTAGYGLLGFLDDYSKVTKQTTAGISRRSCARASSASRSGWSRRARSSRSASSLAMLAAAEIASRRSGRCS